MQEQTNDTNYIIRTTARDAAKAAAHDFDKTNPKRNNNSSGLVALYTWGTLAMVCALYAGAAGMFPNLSIVNNQSTIVAAADKAAEDEQNTQPDLVMALQDTAMAQNTQPIRSASVEPSKKLANVDMISTGSIDKEETSAIAPSLNLGATIGHSNQLSELAFRYMALNKRAPDIFESVQPRLKAPGSEEMAQATLIAGPFATKAELSNFCREVRLRLTIDCTSTEYSGDIFEVTGQN